MTPHIILPVRVKINTNFKCLVRSYLLSLLHVVQVFIQISLVKIKVCIGAVKFKSLRNNLQSLQEQKISMPLSGKSNHTHPREQVNIRVNNAFPSTYLLNSMPPTPYLLNARMISRFILLYTSRENVYLCNVEMTMTKKTDKVMWLFSMFSMF